jgi:histidyl-tRNA synthetase
LFNSVALPKPKLLFLNFTKEDALTQLKAVKALRNAGIKSEIYPDTATSNKQQKKQWKYVSTREILFVISEIQQNKFLLKDMNDGSQTVCTLEELIDKMQ